MGSEAPRRRYERSEATLAALRAQHAANLARREAFRLLPQHPRSPQDELRRGLAKPRARRAEHLPGLNGSMGERSNHSNL